MDDLLQSFRRSETGMWTCLSGITLHHPKGRIQITPGTMFAPGTDFMGVDLAAWLDEQMRKRDARRRPA